MKEALGILSLWLISMILILLISLLKAYIALDVSKLFEIPKLSELLFYQMFGLAAIVNLLTTPVEYKKNDDDLWDITIRNFKTILLYTFVMIIFWGMAYVMAFIIK